MSRPRDDRERRIGLVAGWGRFPILLAEALSRQGYAVHCLGIKDHADPSLAEVCHDFRAIGAARLGAQIRYFRQHGVSRTTLAGKLDKVLLFRRFVIVKHLPDWTCIRAFYPHFISRKKDRNDDAMLTTVVETYANGGVEIAAATELVPELLMKHGQLAGRRLTAGEEHDIEFGWQLAKEMGRLDVGQTVAVKGRAVLAVEAVEGTDECIRRAGRLCPAGGFTVVKVAKPNQDMRFDVPTVGVGTLESMRAAGGRVLAVEADKTILIDEPQVAEFAERHKITLIALSHPATAGRTSQTEAA